MVEAEGFDPIVITLVSDREDDSDGSLAIVESDSEEIFISRGPNRRCGSDCEELESEAQVSETLIIESTDSEDVDAVIAYSEDETEVSESEPVREDVASNTGGTNITREILNEDLSNQVYIPDVEVIGEREIIQNEIRTQITVEQEQTMMMNVEEVDTNNKSTTIIAVTVSIVILLAVAYCMRVLYQRMNAEELEKLEIQAKQAEMVKMKTVQKKQKVESVDAIIDQVRAHGTSEMKMMDPQVEDQLEEQYNPLHDFAVFGVGNDRIGGNQTLQEKMNLADQSSSGEEEEGESDAGNKSPEKKEKPKTPQFVAAGDMIQSYDSSNAMMSTKIAAGSEKNDNQS